MRCFLGIELSTEVREAVQTFQESERERLPSARWVRSSNLHVTLRFLGEWAPELVSSLCQALRQPVRACDRFSLDFRGCRVFPNEKRPRVLSIGISSPDRAPFRLRAKVDASLAPFGLEPEKRSFEPHLTIARFKKRKGPDEALRALIASCAEHPFGEVHVDGLVLFESRLSSGGARYRVVERFPLGGKVKEQLV